MKIELIDETNSPFKYTDIVIRRIVSLDDNQTILDKPLVVSQETAIRNSQKNKIVEADVWEEKECEK